MSIVLIAGAWDKISGESMAYDAAHGQVLFFGTARPGPVREGERLYPRLVLLSARQASEVSQRPRRVRGWKSTAPISQRQRAWAGADFNGNTAPASLDGVQVTIGGQKAFDEYLSDTGESAVADNDLVPVTFNLGGAAGTQTLYIAVHQ